MSNVDISESEHFKKIQDNDDTEIGETYEDRGYSKIPIDQINLNTEPISISSEFSHTLFDSNIKSYIKVFLGFIVFIIILFMVSILSGHFHYEKIETNEKEEARIDNLNNMDDKVEDQLSKTPFSSNNNMTLNESLINNTMNNNTQNDNNK